MLRFKDIPDYEGLYAINEKGEIWSYKSNKLIKPSIIDGYYKIKLRKNGERRLLGVHRLIALTFIPNPDFKPIPHHIDGNGLNNNIENLKWVTQSENMFYAISDGKLNTPEHLLKIREANRKLSDEDVLLIKKIYAEGKRAQRQIAKEYNVCQRTINMILNNITFKELRSYV